MSRSTLPAAVLLLALSGAAMAQGSPKVHRLPATPQTVAWGYYSAAAKPVLRIASGDILEVETLLTSTPPRLEAAGVPAGDVEASLRAINDSVKDKGPGGHILTGPVYVEGAEAGDVLEVRILEVKLAISYGYNGCSGFLRELCADPRTRIIQLDRKKMIADLGSGIIVPLRPFFGSMGVAPPPDSGRVSSNPPGIHAGNLDNKELVAGTTLFIPVHVAGALFAVKEMVAYLMEAKALPQVEAYRLASIAADLRITQLVDGEVGVMIPKSVLWSGRQ